MTEMYLLLERVLGWLMTRGSEVELGIAPIVAAAAISAAASIGNAIFGGISAKKQKKQQLKAIKEAQRENRNWYNRRYNEDATQRADTQRMLTRTNDAIKKRTRAAYGRKAVVGGTDASIASTQQENAVAMGNAMSDIVANAEARKDNIEQQYRARQQELENQKSNVQATAEQAKREATAQAATGAVSAMSSVIANSGDATGANSTGASKTTGSNSAVKSTTGANKVIDTSRTTGTMKTGTNKSNTLDPWLTARRISY